MYSSTPKVLQKIANKTMLERIIKVALDLSDDVSVVLYNKADEIENFIKMRFENIKIFTQDFKNYPGTAGALMACEFNKKRTLVLNGDMPLVQSKDLEGFLSIKNGLGLCVLDLDNPSGYGRVIIKNGSVVGVVEEKDATKEQKKISYVNAGVYSFDSQFLRSFLPKLTNNNAQKEYYITDLIALASDISPIFGDKNSFLGVNSKLELALAEEILHKRIRQKHMTNGVRLIAPQTTIIDDDVVFEGECEVGANCVVEGKTLIKNSTLKSHCVVESAMIFDSTIGPFARIRPSSIIERTHIGNFVEVKKSHLVGVKAGHLSYLGDAYIDDGTNIGAGTITCNYDGKQKHKTTIGKNVFVGSNTEIVAPVVIEDEAIIGAGTTITNNVPKGSLAISRVVQTNVANFFKKFFDAQK